MFWIMHGILLDRRLVTPPAVKPVGVSHGFGAPILAPASGRADHVAREGGVAVVAVEERVPEDVHQLAGAPVVAA